MAENYNKHDELWRFTLRFLSYYEKMPGVFPSLDAYHDLADGSYFMQCSAGRGTEFYAEPPSEGHFTPASIRRSLKR